VLLLIAPAKERRKSPKPEAKFLRSFAVFVCKGEEEGGVGLFLLLLASHLAESIPQDLASCREVAVMFVEHGCP